MAPVIVAQDLYKCYPGFPPVLRGVNITVQPGEMVAIMGPSGCGKSTMLHVLGMLHAPDAGSLRVLDEDVLTLDREQTAAFRRGNMGFVMQSSNLFDHSTVFENVEFPLIYENIPPAERWERVIRALELVRLSHRVNYRSNRLSGGEQQRVAIARAMVNNPRILLADEPTGALDARTSKVVMENFRTLAHEGGVAMVVVTHDPTVAEYCDSVYTLEEGILHCKKQEPVPAPQGGFNLLQATPRRMNTACVVGRFPKPAGTSTVQTLFSLHDEGVLARVYSLRGAGLAALGEGQYSLPVPVRRLGLTNFVAAGLTLLRHLRGNSSLVWQRWKSLPRRWRPCFWLRRLRSFAQGAHMAEWCLDDKVEHLHALGAHEESTAAWVASGLLGIPFSFSVHMPEVCGQAEANLRALAVKARDAAFVRCDTEETRQLMRQACGIVGFDLPDEKLPLLRDSLTLSPPQAEDEVPLAPAAKAAEEDAGLVHLLAVGSMVRRKGYDVLLKACARLKKEGVHFRLTLVGQGKVLRCLQWRAFGLGLRKQTRFLGQVPHEQVPELLRKSTLFVAPGVVTRCGCHDGLPTALTEAMLYGLPVVASDLPGQVEVLRHEQNGLVVPRGDASALAAGIMQMLRFPEQAQDMGRQGQSDIQALLEAENKAPALAQALLRCKAQV